MAKRQIKIYGLYAVKQAIINQKSIEELFINQQSKDKNEILKIAKNYNIPFTLTDEIYLRQRFPLAPQNDVVAILSNIKFVDPSEIFDRLRNWQHNNCKIPIIIALDRVTNPGNIGTIIRTIDASGACGLISDNSIVISNNRLMHNSSAGAVERIPIARTFDLADTLKTARSKNIRIYATSSHNLAHTKILYQTDFSQPAIIVLGSEELGVSEEILSIAETAIKIPMLGTVESLNVAIAAGIILYEAVRQIHNKNSIWHSESHNYFL